MIILFVFYFVVFFMVFFIINNSYLIVLQNLHHEIKIYYILAFK